MADTAVLCPDLTEYELSLCDYALGVVRGYRDEPEFIEEIAPGLRRTRLHELICGAEVMDVLRACPVTERELADCGNPTRPFTAITSTPFAKSAASALRAYWSIGRPCKVRCHSTLRP